MIVKDRLKGWRLAPSSDRQARPSVVVEESQPSPWRRLDYVPARLAVPLAMLIGAVLPWATWTLPDVLADTVIIRS